MARNSKLRFKCGQFAPIGRELVLIRVGHESRFNAPCWDFFSLTGSFLALQVVECDDRVADILDMTTLFEIVELPDGEIALRRADESGEPLVSIRFSKESLYFLDESRIDIAKAMIEAGLEAAGEMHDDMSESDDSGEQDADHTLH